MSGPDYGALIARQFDIYGATFTAGHRGPEIPNVLVTVHGAVDGNPLRADFYGPKGVEDGSYLILIFDLRTKNEVGNSSSPISFTRAIEDMDWSNVLGALTH